MLRERGHVGAERGVMWVLRERSRGCNYIIIESDSSTLYT